MISNIFLPLVYFVPHLEATAFEIYQDLWCSKDKSPIAIIDG